MTLTQPYRMLFWTREEFMTFRVDIDVLFGRELLGRGHAIDFVMQAPSPKTPPGAHRWHGRTVFVGRASGSGLVGRFTRHLFTFWHDLKLLLRARRQDYDAVQFRDKFLIAAIGILVARSRRQKFFYWLSFPFPEDDRLRARSGGTRFPVLVNLRGTISAWLLYRWILPRADHAFVQSERMKEDIGAHGIARTKMTAVPMGIDLGDIPSRTSRVTSDGDGTVVLGYLGALNADRHIEMLVDMLADLRADNVQVRLLLVGDAYESADREALLLHARRRNVAQWLQITGSLPRPEALKRIQGVDIAISPYFPSPLLLSTSPTKLVEYLALGLPVVANEHPEQRAVLAESGAGVCAPWGARYFARSVRWLLRRSQAELVAMGSQGRDWVKQHRTYSKIADDLECKYRELLGDHAPRHADIRALHRERMDG